MKKFRQILEGTVSSNEQPKMVRTESDAAYAASLKKIAMDKQIDSLSNRDRETLARIADMMKNANNDRKEDISENDMSLDDIKKKWAKEIIAFQDGDGDLPRAAEMDMFSYHGSDAIKTDDPDEFDDFVMGLQMAKYKKESVEINESDKDKISKIREKKAELAQKTTAQIKKYDDEIERAAGDKDKTAKIRGKKAELAIKTTAQIKKYDDEITRIEKAAGIGESIDEISRSMTPMRNKFGTSTLAQQQKDKTKSQHDAHAKRMNTSARDSIKKYDQVKKDREADARRAGVGRPGETARQRAARLGQSQKESINEAYAKKFSKSELDKLRKKYSSIGDQEAADYMDKYSPSKIGNRKGWTAISYPVRDGDYYFALIPNNNANEKTVRDANDAINTELKGLAGTGKFKGDPDGLYTALMQWVYNNINHQFGYGDTLTREEIYGACKHILGGKFEEVEVEVNEESYDVRKYMNLKKQLANLRIQADKAESGGRKDSLMGIYKRMDQIKDKMYKVKYEEVEVNEVIDVSDLRIGKRKKAPKIRFKKGGSLGEVNEAIDAKDYKVDSEKSQFNDGHRGKVVHKEKGTTMYLGGMSWKTPDAAKGHANAYLMGYEIGGETGAKKAQDRYVDQNQTKRITPKKESFKSWTEGAKEDALRAIKNDKDFKQVKDVDVRATTADMKLAKKNPIQQLRKISDYGRGQMEFLNNKKLKVSKQEADALLRGFDAMKKPQDKEKYQTMISKDSAGLKRILKIVNK